MSSHHLQIESGRYQGTPSHLRLCQRCNSGEVEDEIHFLLCCTNHNDDRQLLYDTISQSCANFRNLNIMEKFIWLMNCENTVILKELSRFINKHCN